LRNSSIIKRTCQPLLLALKSAGLEYLIFDLIFSNLLRDIAEFIT